LVTSHRCAIAAPPPLVMRAAVSLAAASSISRQATLAPASAKVIAIARPMPSAAPTTMEGLLSSRKGLSRIEPTPYACVQAALWHQSDKGRGPDQQLRPLRSPMHDPDPSFGAVR